MAKRGQLIVRVGLQTSQFYNGLGAMQDRLLKFAAMAAGPLGFGMLIKRGVEFNKTLETAQVGIAAILRQFQPHRFETTAAALGKAGEIMGEIKEQAMLTVDTIRDLTMGYKNLSGVMFQANVPVEKQVKLLVLMSQAVRGMGLGARGQQMFQLIEETRALLTGQVTRYSVVAQQLVAKAPGGIDALRAAIREGRAFEFIRKHLLGFEEAGNLLNKTLEGSISNLNDIIDAVLGFATTGLIDQLKVWIIDMQNLLKDPAVQEGMKRFVDALVAAAKYGAEKGGAIAGAIQKNQDPIVFGAKLIGGIWAIRKFYSWLGKLGAFFVSFAPLLGKAWGHLVGLKVIQTAGGISTVATGASRLAMGLGRVMPWMLPLGMGIGAGVKGREILGLQEQAEAGEQNYQAMLGKQAEAKIRQAKDADANRRLQKLYDRGAIHRGFLGTGTEGIAKLKGQMMKAKLGRDEMMTAFGGLLPSMRSLMSNQDRLHSLRMQRRSLEMGATGITAANVMEWGMLGVQIAKLKRQFTSGFMGGIMGGIEGASNAYTKRGMFTRASQMQMQSTTRGILEDSRDYLRDILEKIQGPDYYSPT